MAKHFFNLLVLITLSIGLSAQDIVLDKNVDDQYEAKRGPNMRQYGQMYEGVGLVVPYNNLSGASAELARSGNFIIGYRYKLKLLSFYAIGYDLSASWVRYGIKSESAIPVDVTTNPLSQASQVKKLSLGISSFGAEAYNRVNIGKRGNTLGNYIDIGIKADWNYGRRLIIREKVVPGSYYEKAKSEQKNLNFIEKFSTLVTARIGINKFLVYGNYRISDLISKGFDTPELPPLIAGIQMAF